MYFTKKTIRRTFFGKIYFQLILTESGYSLCHLSFDVNIPLWERNFNALLLKYLLYPVCDMIDGVYSFPRVADPDPSLEVYG